jgi:thiamine biosynthesis lipoprotein
MLGAGTGLHRVEPVMGMPVSLDIADPLPPARLSRLADQTFEWLRLVDRLFSTYLPDSEVCRLDRGELRAADCASQVRTVLDECARLWADTDGYFDTYATGRLDPSGYVKGWAVQLASDRLAAAGADNHCLNAGGDVRVRGYARPAGPRPAGPRPGGPADVRPGQPWRIGIRHPWQPSALCWVLAGSDLAVATSGTYERGPHVLDPRRGVPAVALRSVTVVGPDLGTADAYATAALAMGLAGIDWLATVDGYQSAVVTEDGRCLRSAGLPVAAG